MPTRILEFGPSEVAALGGFPIVPARSELVEQAAITATSSPQLSAVFNAATVLVCVQSDEQIYVKVNVSPTVTTNSYRIAAGAEQWFDVAPGSGSQVQVRT